MYDASGAVFSAGEAGELRPQPPLWLCGHFVAKPFARMLADLNQAHAHAGTLGEGPSPLRCMLWQSKSAIQPRGLADEWARLGQMSTAVRRWASEGRAESLLRPGSVDAFGGQPGDYRPTMTPVPLD
uniref:Uncharacterized protein n=1 Tax=Calcidiscus leptoporus TaxID=127549 RepID=A0A7S0JLS5_9EUKA